jgi:hypothetical protein
LSLFQIAPVMLMLMLLWIIVPTPQVMGAVAGVAALSLVHLLWMRQYRRRGLPLSVPDDPRDGTAAQ